MTLTVVQASAPNPLDPRRRLSPHFTLGELTVTQVRDVSNKPTVDQVEHCLVPLAKEVLEPMRQRFGAYFISSGFRSDNVNKIIGGSPSSKHRCRFRRDAAADGWPLNPDISFTEVIEWLREQHSMPLDQVIYESPGDSTWLHVGMAANPRGEFLMTFAPGLFHPWHPKDPRITR